MGARIGSKIVVSTLLASGAIFLATLPTQQPAQAQAEKSEQADLNRRLQEIERKLDELLAERQANAESTFWDEEARTKAAIWSRLVRDGLIGRYDCPEVSPDKLLTTLCRRFLKRRPTDQELKKFLESYGPGAEQFHTAPEIIVRRMLAAPGSPKTPLEEAILHAAGQTPPAAPGSER